MSIERRIITGLIVSTEFIQQTQNIWNTQLLESQMPKRLATWCLEYYEKYSKAPEQNIQSIYYAKAEGLQKDIAEDIEDILNGLSEQYEDEKFNLDYLLDQTRSYFKEKHLLRFSDEIKGLLSEGQLLEADKLACDYKPLANESGEDLDLSSTVALKRVEKAFKEAAQPLIRYPRQLGEFWNTQLVRGSLVALMASEKRGKTFWLLDMAIRACAQRSKVVFFQAGDMTEGQQLKRLCTYLTKKSSLKKYSGKMTQPVRDCVYNQLNTCDREERESDFGIFEDKTEEQVRTQITLDELKDQLKANSNYIPCHHCKEYGYKKYGAPWIENVDTGSALTAGEAKDAIETFFINNKRRFKLSSHANGTLSIKQIKALLDIWEKQDDFVPDVIVIDYADLLVEEMRMEFRHQQNEIWKGMRNLSQERHCLVLTATQADAKSYEQNRPKLSNFSEDKRKYAHTTAVYGLNQDPKDREKKIGLMRINELVIREGDFSNSSEVTILQNLRRGRPFLSSYW